MMNDHYQGKVYILGGFGGLAGLDLAQKLFNLCRQDSSKAHFDGDDVRFCLDSHPGDTALHETVEQCVTPLTAGLERAETHRRTTNLEKLVVCIGCNTMHAALRHIQVPLSLEIVMIMDATMKSLSQIVRTKVKVAPQAILWSTQSTFDQGLYHLAKDLYPELKRVELIAPPGGFDDIKELYSLVKAGKKKPGEPCEEVRAITIRMMKEYPPNTVIVLGCTELPLLIDDLKASLKQSTGIRFIDCNKSLARECLVRAKIPRRSKKRSSFDAIQSPFNLANGNNTSASCALSPSADVKLERPSKLAKQSDDSDAATSATEIGLLASPPPPPPTPPQPQPPSVSDTTDDKSDEKSQQKEQQAVSDLVDWKTMPAEKWIDWQARSVLNEEHDTLINLFLRPLFATEFQQDAKVKTSCVVDLGCGNGQDILNMLEIIDTKTVDIVGIDFNQSFLDAAAAQAKRLDVQDNKLHWVQLDLTDDASCHVLRGLPSVNTDNDANTKTPKLWLCLGNAIGIIPDWQKALDVISSAMDEGEKLLLVSHDGEQLASVGIPHIYKLQEESIGAVDNARSDIPNGKFVSKNGYCSQWFSKQFMMDSIKTYANNLKSVWSDGPRVHGTDIYGLFIKEI